MTVSPTAYSFVLYSPESTLVSASTTVASSSFAQRSAVVLCWLASSRCANAVSRADCAAVFAASTTVLVPHAITLFVPLLGAVEKVSVVPEIV
ncbi:MAG: hypothetical protein OSB18_10920 [SAR324 cluster bacterium]|nr:hypothetical protein [SAR324 cluster bacterium]